MKPSCSVRRLAILMTVVAAWSADIGGAERVDFVRDVQPILAARCAECHGADEQEGKLRLDAKAIVFAGGASGPAIVRGKAAESLLYQRLVTDDVEQRMPLDEPPLTKEQIALIRRWIDEGAAWPDGVGSDARPDQHWAYVQPGRAPLPAVNNAAWPRNPLDNFVLAQLERRGMTPSPPAERARLLRRVYLDLVGLPPSVEQVEAFVKDPNPDAYNMVVDRLLASPQYGAKWARGWLDLARYADSNGYQADQYRNVWPYRDWVINAMNDDMRFDRFTIEQLAGDLLPDATLDQKIATGFHRLTTCNVEAGVDPEENRVNQIIDRVNTTGTVWLGTTIECTQCHNHKYDPFTQKDFYRLFAYFNNTPIEVDGNGVTFDFVGPKMELPLDDDDQARRDVLEQQIDDARQKLLQMNAEREKLQPDWEQNIAAQIAADTSTDPSAKPPLPEGLAKILAIPRDKRTPAQRQKLNDHFLELDPQIIAQRKRVDALRNKLDAVQPPTTLVMVEDKPRDNFVFKRGVFLDHGEPVSAGTPRVLHQPPAELPDNRLGLARWLIDRDNPLVGRVVVNRWWSEFFGRGIVATLEDFGTQGERPTHPELLDWLACEFADRGWSMKHVHRLIVTSATYQQSSRVTPDRLRRDPQNQWYARGPRFRLSAETIRDNALAISGLFSPNQGGPPIFPPQPDGVWRHVGRNEPKYNTSKGNDRFRRGIYVVWRRSAPYPSFTNFDAPDRASCVIQRPRTNTAIQALTLLNDPAYLEMAAGLAHRMAGDHTEWTIEEKAAYGFRLCVSREPDADELQHLAEVYCRELAHFQSDPKTAAAIVQRTAVGDLGDVPQNELAAWFFVANILLNLDETITKG